MTPLALLSQIPAVWRKRILAIAAGVLVLCAVFEAGKFSNPAKIIEHTKTVHDVVQVAAEAKTDSSSSSSSTGTARDRSIEETHHPDGTVTVITHDVETKIEYRDVVHTVEVEKIVTVEKKVEVEKTRIVETARPQWRAGLLVGLTTSSSRVVAPELLFPVVPLDAGVTLERRIAGTVWMGAWLNTDKSAGVSLAMEF